jgi:hypothetical protein
VALFFCVRAISSSISLIFARTLIPQIYVCQPAPAVSVGAVHPLSASLSAAAPWLLLTSSRKAPASSECRRTGTWKALTELSALAAVWLCLLRCVSLCLLRCVSLRGGWVGSSGLLDYY